MAQPTLRQRQAERFARFRIEYRRNGGNAFQAALAAGYTPRMAKSKSYMLARWVKAEPALRRLGLIRGVADLNSYRVARPERDR